MTRPPAHSMNFVSSSRQANLFEPIASTQRVTVIDALRGFALFGVLTANLYAFSFYFFLHKVPYPGFSTETADQVAAFLKYVLLEGKFYSIFSLLFGIGFAIQLRHAQKRQANGVAFFKRRLLILLCIGLVHLCLVWPGDILVLYALIGYLLLLFRKVSDQGLLRWAVVLLALPVLFYLPLLVSPRLTLASPLYMAAMALISNVSAGTTGPAGAYMDGSWRDFFTTNAVGSVFRYAALILHNRPFKVLAMFLLGLWLGRRALYLDLPAAVPRLRRVALWGLAIGIPASVAMAVTGIRYPETGTAAGLVYTVFYALGVAPLALAYAALFALLWQRTAWRRALSTLAPAGRMALTNYLMQTFIGIALFYGIGLGWGGKVGPSLLWPLAVLIFGLQVVASTYWLRAYRFGPMEWLWRSLTYGRFQPMRIKPPVPAEKKVA